MKARIICCALTLLVVACKTTSIIEEPNDNIEVISSEPELLFVSYKFQGDELALINKIVANGKLKAEPLSIKNKVQGDLIFQQLDAEKKVLSSVDIANPRTRIVEYANEDGVFSKKTVEVEDPEFSLRVELEPKTKYIAILVFIPESNATAHSLNLTELK